MLIFFKLKSLILEIRKKFIIELKILTTKGSFFCLIFFYEQVSELNSSLKYRYSFLSFQVLPCCFLVLSHCSILYPYIRKLPNSWSNLYPCKLWGYWWFNVTSLFQARLELELKKTPKLRKFWNLIKKNDEKMDPEAREQYVAKALFHVGFLCWVVSLRCCWLDLLFPLHTAEPNKWLRST